MEDPQAPAFRVHQATMCGFIPLARYFSCARCERELTDWVMKQSVGEPSACPNCEVRIGEKDLAQAQRDTKLGCLRTLVAIVCGFLALAAAVGVAWLMTDPRFLNRFR